MARFIVECFNTRDGKPYYAGSYENGWAVRWATEKPLAKRFASREEALREVESAGDGSWWRSIQAEWDARIVEVTE